MQDTDDASRRAAISEHLDHQLHFHRRWRRRTMVAHVFIATAVVTASTLATIISALNGDLWASICAGMATVLIGFDKSLMFKEKWRLHVAIVTRLEALKLGLAAGEISVADAVHNIETAIERYADELPFPARD